MFYDILLSLCTDRNVKITNVVVELGFSPGNLSKWKSGNTPRGDTLSKLADYFHVTTDYLLGRTDDPSPAGDKNPTPPVLNPNEIQVALAYRAADERTRKMVDLALEPWKKASTYNEAM